MRALTISQYGGPDVLTVTDLPMPIAGPGQILVRTAASGVNPIDLAIRSGALSSMVRHPMPLVLGWDLSGTVETVGEGVDRFVPGDRVIAMSAQMATGIGTHAEYVALDAKIAAPAPTTVELVHAAALPATGLTAYQALEDLALQPGERLLITGAVGAVGGFAVQLATARGVHVVAVVRPGDIDQARHLGAATVLSSDEPIPDAIADALFDTAGLGRRVINGIRDGGRVLSIVPDLPKAERGITVELIYVEQSGNQLAQLAQLVDQGVLTLRVAEVGDFAFAPRAHERLAAGGIRGKLLLTPPGRNAA